VFTSANQGTYFTDAASFPRILDGRTVTVIINLTWQGRRGEKQHCRNPVIVICIVVVGNC
jgi:hypothetical protein